MILLGERQTQVGKHFSPSEQISVTKQLSKVQMFLLKMICKGVLLKPRTTGPLTTDQPTTYHLPTDRLLLTCIKIEDQALNMFCIL